MGNGSKIGFVIPTLGRRPEMLSRLIRNLEPIADKILIVSPEQSWKVIYPILGDRPIGLLADDGKGLAAAINVGLREIGDEVDFVNWIGDDDGVYPEAFRVLFHELKNGDAVAVFGDCNYLLVDGSYLAKSKAGGFALDILNWGPDLVPQPSTLFRRDALKEVGFLDERLNLAFDYDLFLKLQSYGEIRHVPVTAAFFTWHSESLSVSQRKKSAQEAHRVRLSHSEGLVRLFVSIVSPLVAAATVVSGHALNIVAKRKMSRS